MGMEYGRDHNSHWIHDSIQLYNGVLMDVIEMWTQELHSEMESCNKYQLFGSIIPTHDHEVSPDPQQTSPGPYLLLFMVFFNFDINVLYINVQ